MVKQLKEFPLYGISNNKKVILLSDSREVPEFRKGYVQIPDIEGKRRNRSVNSLYYEYYKDEFIKEVNGILVEGYSNYLATMEGNIFSFSKSSWLSPTPRGRNSKREDSNCDLKVALVPDNGIRGDTLVHRFIAKAFIPNPENKPQVNHKDGNPSNNHVDNLEWVTAQENMQHASQNYLFKGTQRGCVVTRLMTIEVEIGQYGSLQEASDILNLGKDSNKHISMVCAKNDGIIRNTELGDKVLPYEHEGYIFRYTTKV